MYHRKFLFLNLMAFISSKIEAKGKLLIEHQLKTESCLMVNMNINTLLHMIEQGKEYGYVLYMFLLVMIISS